MDVQTAQQLNKKKCAPCEGGVSPCPLPQAQQQLTKLDSWSLSENGSLISRKWQLKDFCQAMTLLNRCGELAEEEQHHPDFHLTGYRNVRIDLTTHAIGGLSENDFIMAAKIDAAAAALGL